MAAPKPTHIVVHPKLYLSVKGNLQHVEKGKQIALTDKIAKGLGAKVAPISEASVEVDSAKDESGDGLNVSGRARILAEEHGIDLATIKGTGKDGAISKPDVQAAIDGAG